MSVSESGAKGEGDTIAGLGAPDCEAGSVGEPATAALTNAIRIRGARSVTVRAAANLTPAVPPSAG